MKSPAIDSHPILSIEETRSLETRLFGGDEGREWAAMQAAGRAVAGAALRDFDEIGGFPPCARVLVLAGKGHNAGDALIAARVILERFPRARAEVVFPFGERSFRPLAWRAWRELAECDAKGEGRVSTVTAASLAGGFDLSLDGIFGFQFRPPYPPEAARSTAAANRLDVRLRAAVDLPSGLAAKDAFRADFTYATGAVKEPLLGCPNAGRPRYLDLGFFNGLEPGDLRVLIPSCLASLAVLRPAVSDKRSQGHLFVVAGSRGYPGASLMAVLSALRSGVGLVTAFVPESLAPGFAARAPEAMWVGWPETAAGGLASKGRALLLSRLGRATALLIGPGLGREPETLTLAADLARTSTVPLVLDADALHPEIARACRAPRICTPHAGEFVRIAGDASLPEASRALGGTIVLKGPVTRVSGGGAVYHSFQGGPVLSRGGSGDLLAGLIGGLLAQVPDDPLGAACRGVLWHGAAADALARAHGQTAVRITQLLDFLAPALREWASCQASSPSGRLSSS